ncbi:glutamate carboxypeptidase II [Malassezia nana]|uniref:Glutamate carboxypeptidase II n=1 Tax=Malassezia nana TaxID=180528 RepID=A0AAF0J4M5_9BASI|nr:glutamate carboxypeptidase II [Malassezia nana]
MSLCQEHRERERARPASPLIPHTSMEVQEKSDLVYAPRAPRRIAWRTYVLLLCVAGLFLWRGWREPAPEANDLRDRLLHETATDVRCRLRTAHAQTPECHRSWHERLAKLESEYVKVPSAASVRAALQRYTTEHHYAGEPSDKASALRLIDEWSALLGVESNDARARVYEAGSHESRAQMERPPTDWEDVRPRVWADTYAVWLDEPVDASVSVVDAHGQAVWNASLAEDVLPEDPSSAQGLPPFHGYSFSGNASGPLVYAGTGSPADFAELEARGVRVAGSIALVRYGGLFRGLKVRAAQEAGAVGVLIYSDPKEDGHITEAEGHAPYPAGPARQPSSVQRGSVQALSFYPGDPSTPGRPSYRNATRAPWSEMVSMPRIPSLPLSYANARRLLALTQGRGVRADDVRPHFGGRIPDTEYWTGPSELHVSMSNEMHRQTRDIWNVYAVVPGIVDHQRIMVGNHRDAWVFGAGDPSSGTAVLHELIKGLGALLATGWRPLRTIVLASWDAEEYGLVGSTEFGEDYASFLQSHVAMYHNLDMAVQGSSLAASGSPSLAHLLRGVAQASNLTLDHVAPLGSGSDYTVFLQHLGIPSTDVSFRRIDTDPVYHYHSNYDSFAWMDRFGDPGFHRHETMARMWGRLVLRSTEAPLLPIDVQEMAAHLWDAYHALRRIAPDAALPWEHLEAALHSVHDAADRLDRAQHHLEEEAHKAARQGRMPSCHWFQSLLHMNKRLQHVEQALLDKKGLALRPWFRHLGVAPGRWLGYGATTLPGLTESFTLDHGAHAADELQRLVAALHRLEETMSRDRF